MVRPEKIRGDAAELKVYKANTAILLAALGRKIGSTTNIRGFCLVHIDCDLYAPFAAALQYFYPKLTPGAFMAMHDKNIFWGGAEKAIDEFFADKREKLIPIPDKSCTAVIRKIVNGSCGPTCKEIMPLQPRDSLG